MDTNVTSVQNMLLGLEMADWVDQSFVKVHFHKMTTKYSNWLIDKIVDKEAKRIAMREQFLRDNRERLDEGNYEFKRRDNTYHRGNWWSIEKEKTEDKVIFLFFWLWTCLF